MDALSEIILRGRDFLEENLRTANRKVSTVRSLTTSRYTALVAAHVKRQIYIFLSCPPALTYRAPVKSTPVTVNGEDSATRTLGSGGGGGGWSSIGFPHKLVTNNTSLQHFPDI